MRYILQCPLKGWDTKTSLADQQEGYATLLDNYIPSNRFLELRKGFKPLLTLEEEVDLKTIIPFNENNKILVAGGGKIYEAYSDTTLASGLLNDYYVSCYFKHRLFLANGNDTTKEYSYDMENPDDVGTIQNISFTLPEEDTGNLIFAGVGTSNQQLIFFRENELKFYYADVGNISGELKVFDLSQIAKKGGQLMAVASWGKDSSQGYHNYTAFITSEGEIIVYEGTSFDSVDLTIVGNFFTSRPLGRRCVLNWGADIIIITETSYIPMSQIVANGEIIKQSDLFSDKISGAVLERSAVYGTQQGWLGLVSGQERFALFNVPKGNEYEQHIMNLETGAWCRFTGINAPDWCVFNSLLLFCMNNKVYQYTGNSDIIVNDGNIDNIQYINGEIKNVYSKFGTINPKILQLFNSRIECDQKLNISYSVGIDYQDKKYEFSPTPEIGGFYWADEDTPISDDTTRLWDEGEWSSGLENISKWYSISGWGVAISLQIKTQTNTATVRIYESLIDFEESKGALA